MIVVRSTDLGGMAPAALRPMFGLTDDELIVVIRIEEGPPVPQRGLVDVEIPEPPEGVSLRVEAAPAPVQSVVAPMPEDRMHSFSEVEAAARDQRLTLTMVGGVYTLTSDALGQCRHYQTLAACVSALRLRRFD